MYVRRILGSIYLHVGIDSRNPVVYTYLVEPCDKLIVTQNNVN